MGRCGAFAADDSKVRQAPRVAAAAARQACALRPRPPRAFFQTRPVFLRLALFFFIAGALARDLLGILARTPLLLCRLALLVRARLLGAVLGVAFTLLLLRCRVGLGAQRAAARGRWPGRLALFLLDLAQTLLRLAFALLVVEFEFTLAQGRFRLARALAYLTQAAFDGKLLITRLFFSRALLRDGGTLLLEVRALGLHVRVLGLRHGCRRLGMRRFPDCKNHKPRQADATCKSHVNPVSTLRRSSARYSLDCISCSRDTVRGNSCASGPSV